jgi:hypothetical protein
MRRAQSMQPLLLALFAACCSLSHASLFEKLNTNKPWFDARGGGDRPIGALKGLVMGDNR